MLLFIRLLWRIARSNDFCKGFPNHTSLFLNRNPKSRDSFPFKSRSFVKMHSNVEPFRCKYPLQRVVIKMTFDLEHEIFTKAYILNRRVWRIRLETKSLCSRPHKVSHNSQYFQYFPSLRLFTIPTLFPLFQQSTRWKMFEWKFPLLSENPIMLC